MKKDKLQIQHNDQPNMLSILQIEVLRWNRLCKYHNQNLYDKNLYIFPSHQLLEFHQKKDRFFLLCFFENP